MTAPWIALMIALWAVVIFTLITVFGLLQRVSPILERAEEALATTMQPAGLAIGSDVPAFEAIDVNGSFVTDVEPPRAVVLFLGVDCPPCQRLVRDIRLRGVASADMPHELIVVLSDPSEAVALRLEEEPGVQVLFQRDRSLSRAFETTVTPHAFVVEKGRVLASGTPNSLEGIRALVARVEEGGGLSNAELLSR